MSVSIAELKNHQIYKITQFMANSNIKRNNTTLNICYTQLNFSGTNEKGQF